MKPVVVRDNTLEQWRTHTNRISDNVGDPANIYVADAPNNTGVVYTNTSDSYTHPVSETNAVELAILDLNTRKLKRSGDTITGHLNIKQNFSAEGNTTIGTTTANTITINSTPITIPNGLNFSTNLLALDSSKVGIGQMPTDTQKLQVTGNTKLTGTLQVTSTSQYDGTITVGVSKVTIAATTGDTYIDGNLDVNTAIKSNSIQSRSTDTNLVLVGNGTGLVQVNDNCQIVGDLAVNGGDITSTAALLNIGNPAATGSFTTVIVPGAGTSDTRTINIGSAGGAGSTTAINIGPATLGISNINIGSGGVATSRTKLLWGASTVQWSLTDDFNTGLYSENGTVLFQIDANGKLNLKSAGTISDLTVLNDMYINGVSNLGNAVGDTTVIGINTVITTAQPTVSTDTVANIALTSFSATTYRSCEFLVQGVGSTATNGVVTKVYALHDGAGAVSSTEYGRVTIGDTLVDEGGFTVDYNAGNVRLLVNQALANTVWKITAILTKS